MAIEQFYTHCIDICPLETARLAQVQKMLGDRVGKDIFFYSISIDPKRDTPEAMKEYAEKYHAGPGWLFLTGKKEDIALINKKLGFQDPIPGDRDGHSHTSCWAMKPPASGSATTPWITRASWPS